MDDELRHRLEVLLFELFPPEHVVNPLVTGNQLIASYADEVDAVLAEIGKTHVLIAVNDPRIQWADTIDISGIMDETR
jgi:hypothetical protein